jgi:hypothetical protein
MQNRPGKRTPIGNNIKNASIGTVTTLAALAATATASSAVYAQIQAVGDLYLTTDGSTPSDTSYGRKIADGQTYDVTESNATWSNIKMIGTSVSILFSA